MSFPLLQQIYRAQHAVYIEKFGLAQLFLFRYGLVQHVQHPVYGVQRVQRLGVPAEGEGYRNDRYAYDYLNR